MSIVDRARETKKEKNRVSKSYKKRYNGVAEVEKCELCGEYDKLSWDKYISKMICPECSAHVSKSPEKPYIKGGVLF